MRKIITTSSLIIAVILLNLSCDNSDDEISNPYIYNESVNPLVPLLGLPANDTRCEIGKIEGEMASVKFYWISTSLIDRYDLTITNLNTNEQTIISEIKQLETEVLLLRGYSYSWFITSKNSRSTKSERSETWRFYLANNPIENAAPFPAKVLSPVDGSIITPTSGEVMLEWESSDPDENDSLLYSLRLDTINGTTPLNSYQNIPNTKVTIQLEKGKVYYWSVVSSDSNISVESNVFSFRLD